MFKVIKDNRTMSLNDFQRCFDVFIVDFDLCRFIICALPFVQCYTHIHTHTRTQFYSIFCQVRHVPILLHKLQK